MWETIPVSVIWQHSLACRRLLFLGLRIPPYGDPLVGRFELLNLILTAILVLRPITTVAKQWNALTEQHLKWFLMSLCKGFEIQKFKLCIFSEQGFFFRIVVFLHEDSTNQGNKTSQVSPVFRPKEPYSGQPKKNSL